MLLMYVQSFTFFDLFISNCYVQEDFGRMKNFFEKKIKMMFFFENNLKTSKKYEKCFHWTVPRKDALPKVNKRKVDKKVRLDF